MTKDDIRLNKKIFDKAHLKNGGQCYEPENEVIEYLIKKNNYSKIIDFACGTGKVGKYLKENLKPYEFQIDGVEISKNAVKIAKPYYRNIELRYDYRLPNKKYDLILLNSILEHIYDDNLDILFDDIKKKLTPSGSLFIVVPNIHSFIRYFIDDKEKDKSESGHVNMKSKKEWIGFLKKHGFSKFSLSFPLKLKYRSLIRYFPNNKLSNAIMRASYNLFLIYPFYYLKNSFYILVKNEG